MKNHKSEEYLAIPLRDIIPFPGSELLLEVGREFSIKTIREATDSNKNIILLCQVNPDDNEVIVKNLLPFGARAEIVNVLDSNVTGGLRVQVYVKELFTLDSLESVFPTCHILARPKEYEILDTDALTEVDILGAKLSSEFYIYARTTGFISNEQLERFSKQPSPLYQAYYVGDILLQDRNLRIELLNQNNLKIIIEPILQKLLQENEYHRLDLEINQRLKQELDAHQKEYYLREKIRVISEEIGDGQDKIEEVNEYRQKVDEGLMPQKVKGKLYKEINKLNRTNVMSPEYGILTNYLDFATSLPWGIYKEENESIKKAENILNKGHYGLEKVKERILEFLAVQILNKENKGSIICLVGPPGVGKTSLGRSVAEATNRDFVRLSLGGIQDESEIRGHRRTYIGAMAGRIIQGIADSSSANPVFLLDEIDKISRDFRGDPAAALLEALDPSQNDTFSDHYLEIPFDLSRVLFITTANSLSTIPEPLLDRLEIIELQSYTQDEKMQIAKKHLVQKSLEAHGLSKSQVSIGDSAIKAIIETYTRESGVRELERKIATICRKVARQLVEGHDSKLSIKKTNLADYLGASKVIHDTIDKKNQVGVAVGMAWTRVGGEILHLECQTMKGTGKLHLTGQMGNVMKESAHLAMSYVRAISADLGLDDDFYKDLDVHLHIPEGAVPKDGPSAGIAITAVFASAFTKRALKRDIAMTGEMSLRGRVLPVGGIRDKVSAAYRAGCQAVILPKTNEKDTKDLPQEVKENLKIHYVEHIDEVLDLVLLK